MPPARCTFAHLISGLILALLLVPAPLGAQAERIPPSIAARAEKLDQEFSSWRSADGRAIRAKLLRYDPRAGTVTLQREDGNEFTVDESTLDATLRRVLAVYLQRQQPAAFSAPAVKASAFIPDDSPLPSSVQHRRTPMVVQEGSYCVPASAAMIARFHRVTVDQKFLAQLSSRGSAKHYGTHPEDMANAMQTLGFAHQMVQWSPTMAFPAFEREVLAFVRWNLAQNGPMYASFRPGVFGDEGHGCVLVGYDERRLYFHNPWGSRFNLTFREFFEQASNAVAFHRPPSVGIGAGAQAVSRALAALPIVSVDLSAVVQRLEAAGLSAELQTIAPREDRSSRAAANRYAHAQGIRYLRHALDANHLVILPVNEGETRSGYVCIWQDESKRPQLAARYLGPNGWGPEIAVNFNDLLPRWPTLLSSGDWELPAVLVNPPSE
jgi:hypothetical protein